MKVTFRVSRPLRDEAGLKNFSQPAREWLAVLFSSLADQLVKAGDGTIKMEIEGVMFEFRVTEIPGVLSTRRVSIQSEDAEPSGGPRP